MRIASTALCTALSLVVLAHGGVLACSSDAGSGNEPAAGSAGVAGAAVTAGSGGAAAAGAAGAPAGGAGTAGSGGALAGGAGGAAGGSAGASAGSGGMGGSAAGAGGASGGAAGSAGSAGMAGMGGAAPFALTSPAFMNKTGCAKGMPAACDKIPKQNWGPMIGGPDQSPELDWTTGPTGTLSYAIVLYDLSNGYTHWAVWNIPATTNQLPASLPAGSNPAGITGAKQTSFYANKDAYAGPGLVGDVYQFTVYALKVATISPTLPGNDPQKAVRDLLEGSADVLKKTSLTAASVQ